MGLRIPASTAARARTRSPPGSPSRRWRAPIERRLPVFLPALVAEVLVGAADERQRERWLPAIAAGESLPCFCLTEPEHGSDAARLGLRAQRDGAGWRLTGEKTSISLAWARTRRSCSRAPAARARAASARSTSSWTIASSGAHPSRISASARSGERRCRSTGTPSARMTGRARRGGVRALHAGLRLFACADRADVPGLRPAVAR